MKKFLIVIAVLFILNLGCKKIEGGGDRLCACSPITSPYLSLVIKNLSGADLLNPATTGYFAKEQIQLYTIDANGSERQLNFGIRTPFSYGTQQYNYYQLFSVELAVLAKSIENVFYLKLENGKIFELNAQTKGAKLEKLLINKEQAPFEQPTMDTYSYVNSIFLLQIK